MNLSQGIMNIMSSMMLINIKGTERILSSHTGISLRETIGNSIGSVNNFDNITTAITILGVITLASTVFRMYRIHSVPNAVISFIENKNSVSLAKEPTISSIIDKDEELFKKPTMEFDFQDMILNTIVSQILEKVKYLKNHDIVKKDMEIALIVENTKTQYLKQTLNTYMNVPKYKRGIIEDKESPIYSAKEQLNTILDGLNKVEDRILNNTLMSQKANEIFLKEKMKQI